MRLHLHSLEVRTRQTTEIVEFASSVTFLYGPVGTGKSTVARLIDYCLGGELERTPAIQREFVAVVLALTVGSHDVTIERAAEDNQSVRVNWLGPDGVSGSVNAPLAARDETLIDTADVHNLSDLIFHLCGMAPIKVRQRSRDPQSPLVRLSLRDIWPYCYLEQMHLDSSCFRLEDTFRGRKSQDAMRFFTGLHSDRLSQLEVDLMTTIDEQRSKRDTVQRIREFMARFDLGSESNMLDELHSAQRALATAEERRQELERTRTALTHPTDDLRLALRHLSGEIEQLRQGIAESDESIAEQRALRAELITAKTKALRADQATRVLEGVQYQRCPECGSDISGRATAYDRCRLCCEVVGQSPMGNPLELEALRRDLNERIDQIADSIGRRERQMARTRRQLSQAEGRKHALDEQLQAELARYDSAFVESIRGVERERATLMERIRSLERLQQMPRAIDELEEQAGALQGKVDRLRTSIEEERARLSAADANIAAIATEFKRIMLIVGFPGVSEGDRIVIDPRNWKPTVVHGEQQWDFWDAGSGGKKTLFNVCYALALHAAAMENHMPVPSLLIIDSPTKNISEDENPELVSALYGEIYRLAKDFDGLQFLLIDSNLIGPGVPIAGFSDRRMADTEEAPSLISYYAGP